MRLVEDDWEGPTLGAWGLGWEVWVDGMEVTQFTYFQQFGGLELDLIPAEITYGLERLAMFLQDKRSAFELVWAPGVTWGDVYRENERQWSVYNFEEAPVDTLTRRFEEHEQECRHLVERGLPLPAYDQVLKCSHAFNLLDARGAISVTERASYIGRVRNLARRVAQLYVELMPSLLFEIGCEELPASACREAGRQLRERWLPTLGGTGGRVLVGPRRLALLVEGLPERTPDEWVQGPPEHLREKAAAGFARKHGISAETSWRCATAFSGWSCPGGRWRKRFPSSSPRSSVACRSPSR